MVILTSGKNRIESRVDETIYRTFYPMRADMKKAKALFERNGGLLRTQEAVRLGVHPRTLYTMHDQGLLEQLTRGLYQLSRIGFAYPDLAFVAKKIPKGVICLISALSYHNLTTQIPHFVHVAIPVKSNKSTLSYPPLRYFWYSNHVYESGVLHVDDNGVDVKIYDMEKTLADCVKYRNKIGIDIVIEALKLYWGRRGTKVEKLFEYARINRVEKALQGIMEVLVN